MCVDDSRHFVFGGDIVDQVVDNQRSLGVQAGVRFVTEQIFRVQGDGAGNSGTFHHTAADLRRIEVAGFRQVHTIQTELGTFQAVFVKVSAITMSVILPIIQRK